MWLHILDGTEVETSHILDAVEGGLHSVQPLGLNSINGMRCVNMLREFKKRNGARHSVHE